MPKTGDKLQGQITYSAQIKTVAEAIISQENSVLTKIFAVKLEGRKPLIELIDEDPLKFIDIVLSEISGWTRATINKYVIPRNPEIKERFERINTIINAYVLYFRVARFEPQPDLEVIYGTFTQIINSILELEKIPGNETKTIFSLQYELRRFTTDFFEKTVLKLAKEIVLINSNSRHLNSIYDIFEYSISYAYNTAMTLFKNERLHLKLDFPELKDHTTLINLKELTESYKKKFIQIMYNYFPDATEDEIESYIRGLLTEFDIDYLTMSTVFKPYGIKINEERIEFRENSTMFQGHSYAGYKTEEQEQEMFKNEGALSGNDYTVHTFRKYKDCEGYSIVKIFLRFLEEVLRVEQDPATFEITRIYAVQPEAD